MEIDGDEIQQININFENIYYTVSVPKQKEKKNVLKGISGCFKSGELTAIMGPSGAGKSSLLNILTGFTKQGVKGVLEMGEKNTRYDGQKSCSYILQEDHLYPFFTVNETMTIATNLKISDRCMSHDEKQLLIDQILETLHLTYVKDTRCGSLSGGQKKRLSIALELIDNPPILFLDEPTTGLDSSSSTHTIRLLHNLAREGRTIVCTIHQPSASIYEMFDHVYALAEGHCVYQGSNANTIPYLASLGLQCPQYHSAPDYLLEVTNGEYGNFTYQLAKAAINDQWRSSTTSVYIREEYENSLDRDRDRIDDRISNDTDEKRISVYTKTSDEMSAKFSLKGGERTTPSEWTRLWVLIARCNVLLFRDWTVTNLKFLLHILCGILIGLLFGDSGVNADKSISNVGFLLINGVYLWYTTMMPSVLRFPAEISILKKEVFNNWYKLRTYYLATLITSTPLHVLNTSIYICAVYFLTEQPPDSTTFFKVLFVYILVTIAADGFGILLGTLNNPVNGTFFAAVLSCFMIVLSGFLVLFKHMPKMLQFISDTSILKYSLEACVVTVYEIDRKDLQCPEDVLYCHYRKPETILKELGMENGDYVSNVIKLIAQLLFFKSMCYFTLRRRLLKS
ncbi:CLUMA_CG007841, isoform A [Clunio marinus]|uniref:CLUMA_CG007841, isoform A n=1 Tax=Clunio marinus TaxID=568069 RepID=A0A1J1I5V9_9DIPT|nr:CLUMA_CG007841, isoform A [Clunio marinus]